MTSTLTQKEKAEQLHALHHTGNMLILPNIWDSLGASLLESMGYPAIATASASIAFTNGYNDGEKISFNEVLSILKKIVQAVSVPVTADVEAGYADTEVKLQENINLLLATGVVGINLEDTNQRTGDLYPVEIQCNRIKLIKKVAAGRGIPLFVNARTDVLLHSQTFAQAEDKFAEILKRGVAYQNAGADCFYPITLRQEEDIRNLLSQLTLPINILTLPGIPDLKTLSGLGVARVSLGPNFLKIALKAMQDLALQLKSLEGLPNITQNEVTSEFLKNLVNKNYEGL